jgi:hypothetical protein
MMPWRTVAVGSLEALTWAASDANVLGDLRDVDIVVVPTAAAFTGATEAAVRTAAALDGLDARIEALMVTDRASAAEEYFAKRIAQARWVVLSDGSALHARTTWRESPVGEALSRCEGIVAVGSVATVLGDEMIDPRGGAPTTGLAWRRGVVLSTPAGPDQLARTRALLGGAWTFVVLDTDGVVVEDDGRWSQVSDTGVLAWRGDDEVTLERVSSR